MLKMDDGEDDGEEELEPMIYQLFFLKSDNLVQIMAF
jgi:hypothetical protein